MAEILSVHTMQVRRTISQYEEQEICERYRDVIEEKTDDKGNRYKLIGNPGIKGVNTITISRYKRKDTGKCSIQISLVLNMGKLTGKSRIAMTELRKKNVEDFISAVSDVLDDKLHLHKRNRDASGWNFNRIDVGSDYHIGTDRIEVQQFHMRMLHKSFFPYNARNYKLWSDYYDKSPEKREQSVRVSNGSARYNIYSKAQEIPANHPEWVLTGREHEESDDVIRVEKQIEGQGLKAFGGNKLSRLADEGVTFPIMGSIVDDIAGVFGTGDHVSLYDGRMMIENSGFSEEDKKKMILLRVQVFNLGYEGARKWIANHFNLDEAQSVACMKDCRKKTESLGISMIALCNSDAALLGETRIPSLGKMMQERHGHANNRKSRGRFADVYYDEKNKRYKCNPTLHRADGSKYRTTVAGVRNESRESVEKKVLYKIRENGNKNFCVCHSNDEKMRCCNYIKEELMDYRTTVTNAGTIKIIDRSVDSLNMLLAKLGGDGL